MFKGAWYSHHSVVLWNALDVGVMETGFTDMIPFGTFCSLLHAQSAALAPRKEVPSLIPGTSNRPADIYLPNWAQGRPAALDVTVISTLQSPTVSKASTSQGHALRIGERRKMVHHYEACQSVGLSFVPLVVETLGGWSDDAIQTICKIGRLLGQRLGSPPALTLALARMY